MTKKDLFDGLNYIDDQIIEEAQPTGKLTGESAGYRQQKRLLQWRQSLLLQS